MGGMRRLFPLLLLVACKQPGKADAVDAAPPTPPWAERLAESRTAKTPLPAGTLVHIGEAAVAIDGKDVVPIAELGPPTSEKLAQFLAAMPPATGPVIVAADAGTTYRVLFTVLATVAQSGRKEIAIAARTPAGPGVVTLTVPTGVPIVGAKGPRGPADDLGGRFPGGDLAEQIGQDRRERETTVRGVVKVDAPASDEKDAEVVASVHHKIRSAYAAGLKRCYLDALKTEPELRGRVMVTFEIASSGRVAKAHAKGFDAGVDACIEARVRTWRFATHDGPEPVVYEFPLVFYSTFAGDGPTSTAPAPAPSAPDPAPSAPPAAETASLGGAEIQLVERQPAPDEVQLIVAVSRDRVLVFSLSGLEGTITSPLWTGATAADGLGKALADVAARRFADKPRPAIIVMVDPSITVAALFVVLDVVRDTFPDVILAGGFE
jgi:hypothetical protein